MELIGETTRNRLLRALGPDRSAAKGRSQPEWNRDTRELRYRGKVIRRISATTRAPRIIAILDAFQAKGWPSRVDDPLPGGHDSVRLHGAIRGLNKGLQMIRFGGDGSS